MASTAIGAATPSGVAVAKRGKVVRKFRVRGGSHIEAGRVYKNGSVLASPYDLAEVFKGKFEEVPAETPCSTPGVDSGYQLRQGGPKVEVGEPVEEKDELKRKAQAKAGPEEMGKDVSDSFPGAVEQDFKVFRRDGGYFVYDGDDLTNPLNAEPVKKGEVEGVIDGALAK